MQPTTNEGLVKSFEATALISPYTVVKFNGTGVEGCTAAGDPLIGVDAGLGAAAGETCDVILSGIAECIAAATIVPGAAVTTDAKGHVRNAVAGERILGYAMDAAVVNDHLSVHLQISIHP